MKLRWEWLAGAGVVAAFMVLFTIRLGVFQDHGSGAVSQEALRAAEDMDGSESWMNILQDGEKIGYVHSTFKKTEDGYSVSEAAHMELTALGTRQVTWMNTVAELDSNMVLTRVAFNIVSDAFDFAVRGMVKGDTLTIRTGTGADQQVIDIPLKDPPIVDAAIMFSSKVLGMKPGESVTFPVFSPATMSNRPTTVTMIGEESLTIQEEKIRARKYLVDFMGQKQTAWTDSKGVMLAQEGLLGLRLEKTSRIHALDEQSITGEGDLIAASSVVLDKPIPNPDKLTSITLQVEGAGPLAQGMNGGRQVFRDGVLTVSMESIPSPERQKPYDGDPAFLQADSFVQSDHPEVIEQAREITSVEDAPAVKVRKIIDWVAENIEKKPVFSVPRALDTLRNGVGDCNEHAMLTAALARAAGVPARIEVGLYHLDGRFFYHAWNAFYVGEWVTGDAVFGQFPADATHLRLSQGGPSAQLDIMAVLGRLKLRMLEHTP